MARLLIEAFGGIAPKVAPLKLADTLATQANNCRLDRGRLDVWRGLLRTDEILPVNTETIFPYQGKWLSWPQDVDVVGNLSANDIRDRLVISDDQYPKIRSGSDEYRLGLPVPAAPTTEVIVVGDRSDLTSARTDRYRVSFVDAWGAEGALSSPSASVEVGTGAEVKVLLPAVPTGEHNFGAGALHRIYRSNSGITEALWQLVTEVPITDTEYLDKKAPGELQEAAVTENWIGPPDDDTTLYPEGPLRGLLALPSGSLTGFSGNVVCFSVPFVPHAWPADYRVTIPDGNIVGLAAMPTGLLVCTDKQPFIIQGSSVDALLAVPVQSERFLPCVNKRSIVDMGNMVLYATSEGLAMAVGNAVQLVTDSFFSRHEWQQLQPHTIKAWLYDGKYIAVYGSEGNGFIFDPQGDSHTFTELSENIASAYYRPADGTLLVGDSSGNLSEFDTDPANPMLYFWQSKVFAQPMPVAFTCLRVEAEAYPVLVEIKADGKRLLLKNVNSGSVLRIPSRSKYRQWQVSISGTTAVEYICLSDSMSEVV